MGKLDIMSTLSIFLCTGCGFIVDNSPEILYEEYMNMSVPASVVHFEGDGARVFPIFMSWGYFHYNATSEYFDIITENEDFIEDNEHNIKITETVLSKYEIEILLRAFKGKTKLNMPNKLENMKAYQGTYFPYIHQIFRDTATNETYHFVSGIRE